MAYKLKVSKKARYMRLEIQRDGELVVTVPRGTDSGFVDQFLARKAKWVADKLKYFASIKDKIILNPSKREYVKYKERARVLAKSRISYFNQFYHFKVNRISIKNTKSRWGSCSQRGNLNFNYKIALLPANLADYIIVHELCHLGEMNHSKKFWSLVSKTVPDYKGIRKKFAKIRISQM